MPIISFHHKTILLVRYSNQKLRNITLISSSLFDHNEQLKIILEKAKMGNTATSPNAVNGRTRSRHARRTNQEGELMGSD